MEHLNKLLFYVEKNSELFKQREIGFILGLTNTQIKDLKKSAIEQNFIEEKQRQFFVTSDGKKYLKDNPFSPTEINLEYLKSQKPSPIVTKAIRNLAKHLLSNQELKENSTEDYIKRELIDSQKMTEAKESLKKQLFKNKRTALTDVNIPNTAKPIFAVLLLDCLVTNLDKFAVYEKGQFVLTLDYLVFDRMICCPQNFEIQKVVVENNSLLTEISQVILPEKSNNILEITKGLYRFIKGLENYTINTERLSRKTLRFKNVILNAKDPVNLFYRDIPKVLSNKLLSECNDEFVVAFKSAIEELRDAKIKLTNEIKEFLLTSFNSESSKELAKRFSDIEEYIGEKELKILCNNILNIGDNDILWTDRIATFINKSRVPKDWKDSDVADYKLKVKDLALKFLTIESTAGDITFVLDKKLCKIFEQILALSDNEKNVLLRRVING